MSTTAVIPGTKIPSTGNADIDNALAAQAKASAEGNVLAVKTNTAVTQINAVSSSVRKIQPT